MSTPPAEAPADFPRHLVEFADPADPQVVFRCDLTWLLSSWACIFGAGCRGIVPERPSDGCCSHGAFYTDRADEARVRAAAHRLTDADWQLRAAGRRGISTAVEGSRRTRVVDGACIFLNRPGFSGGAGCALHALAARTGHHPLTTKPDVCWQLPVRRGFTREQRPDGTCVLVTTIGEYDRRAWGAGGQELHWWCTSHAAAHRAAQRLYVSYAAELTELMGAPAYGLLVQHCDRLVASGGVPPHPATVAAH